MILKLVFGLLISFSYFFYLDNREEISVRSSLFDCLLVGPLFSDYKSTLLFVIY